MKVLKFDKYVAAGNDFLLFDGRDNLGVDYNDLALRVCNRHFGIGSDGIMVCENSSIADVRMLYYNSDGSQGEMCGNGIRSFTKYIYDHGIVKKKSISIETLAGIQYIDLETDEHNMASEIRVTMGRPVFQGDEIPVNIHKEKVLEEIINVDNRDDKFSALLVGVPHVVIFVDRIEDVDINDVGKKIENHKLFPKKTNVNFVEIIDPNTINIYTWDRGAGRTLGCGTGSCASVVVGNLLNKLDSKVLVNTEGGNLKVELKDGYEIIMIGNATHVARGEYLFPNE